MAKSNVGMLSEDITKPPYKVFFNPSTNGFSLLNSVLIMRTVEGYLQRKREFISDNKERLVSIHGNRFILHSILQEEKNVADFNQRIIDKDIPTDKIKQLIDDLLIQITATINELYADSYPANIFKNIGKCKAIAAAIATAGEEHQ